MNETATYEQERPRLWSLAYRMLGSAVEADDILQEAWIRWQTQRPQEVRSPGAWLTSVVTHLALDRLKAARAERERYEGAWLPEPVLTTPAVNVEGLSLGFLLLLEQLNPVERAVYLLREVFDHSYEEIAQVIGKSDVACRQLHHRACARLAEARPARFTPTREEHDRLLHAFLEALRQGDFDGLKRLLADDATFVSDGGGKATAVRKPLQGATAIAQFYARLAKVPGAGEREIEVREVNGAAALVVRHRSRVEVVITLETEAGRIRAVRNVLNPDKLGLKLLER